MSVSSRSTKAAMYSEIERLRLELDRVTQQLRAEQDRAARIVPRSEERPRFEHMHQVPRDELAKFTRSYCKVHGGKSVPFNVVREHFLGANA